MVLPSAAKLAQKAKKHLVSLATKQLYEPRGRILAIGNFDVTKNMEVHMIHTLKKKMIRLILILPF